MQRPFARCGQRVESKGWLMKPKAFLVTVAGAVLDAWYRYPASAEPTATQPLRERPDVSMTPHVSGRTARGKPPLSAIEPVPSGATR